MVLDLRIGSYLNPMRSPGHVVNTTTLPQHPVDVQPQPHVGASSSNSQLQVTQPDEGALQSQQEDSTMDPPSSGVLPPAYWGPPHTPRFEDDPADSEMPDLGLKMVVASQKPQKLLKEEKTG